MKNLDIVKMLTVSVDHVKRETCELLALDGIRNEIMLPVYIKSTANNGENYGLYIELIPDCIRNGKIPEDLVPLIKLATDNDCKVLCLDADGPEIEGFQIYNR